MNYLMTPQTCLDDQHDIPICTRTAKANRAMHQYCFFRFLSNGIHRCSFKLFRSSFSRKNGWTRDISFENLPSDNARQREETIETREVLRFDEQHGSLDRGRQWAVVPREKKLCSKFDSNECRMRERNSIPIRNIEQARGICWYHRLNWMRVDQR